MGGASIMVPLLDQPTIQIETTTRCTKVCSNCTHCTGHTQIWDMSMQKFKQAVDSMEKFPRQVGLIGGDPVLSPHFEEQCLYLQKKLPREKLGLWTCFPTSGIKYRKLICDTFYSVFLNDQTRDDILHGPVLVASQEVKLEQWLKDYCIHHCWLQASWSGSITPKGAFFCEVAGALNGLFDLDYGWPVEPGWWTRSPQNFGKQLELCKLCGVAIPLKKRASIEGIDDISQGNYEKLKDISPKLKQKKYNIHDLQLFQDDRQTATYKDPIYREKIANRYGIFLTVNSQGYNEPHLMSDFEGKEEQPNG